MVAWAAGAAAGDGELRWSEPVRVAPRAVAAADGAIALADGRTVHLAAVELPALLQPESASAERARAALAELLDGAEVRLGLAAAAAIPDRYGRLAAQLRRGADGLWVQGELLRRGLARVRTTPDHRALAAGMLALEDEARTAGRGLWADPAYAVRRHDEAAAHVGSFQIVAGRVARVAETRGYIYLNFDDRDRRRDFTVRVRRGDLRALGRDGLDPAALAGRRVRVRGWLLEAGGPLVELSHGEQIEVLE
ncbi:MAG TPA: thermonuclease family protein [Geminicoccaceae bacterium]|nr:thermonuclease family protein [Geminicoccaceae bacterium]